MEEPKFIVKSAIATILITKEKCPKILMDVDATAGFSLNTKEWTTQKSLGKSNTDKEKN